MAAKFLAFGNDPDGKRVAISEIMGYKKAYSGTGTVILGHLSGENNTPELAMKVSSEILMREGIRPGSDAALQVALRDTVGSVYTIKEE